MTELFNNGSLAPYALMSGGIVIGVLAACWSRLKLLFNRLVSCAVVTHRVEGMLMDAMVAMCWDRKRFRCSRFGNRRYGSFADFVVPVGRIQEIGYETPGPDPVVFWKGWYPLVLQRSLMNAKGESPGNAESILITFIRGTFNFEDLIKDALSTYNDKRHDLVTLCQRYFVYRMQGNRGQPQFISVPGDGRENPQVKSRLYSFNTPDKRLLIWDQSEVGQPRSTNPFESLAYSPAVDEVIEDVRRFLKSKEWYKKKLIPWRRGYLVHGLPGTGKTSLVRAVAQENDLPVFSFDLATYGNAEFEKAWIVALSSTPCIVLFEDLDGVFDGRINVTATDDNPGLTFDCFLQTIGGITDCSGVLVFVTSNHADRLDPAIGVQNVSTNTTSRPGRLDRIVRVDLPTDTCRRKILSRILSDCPEEIDSSVEKTSGMSGAQVVEYATELALTRYWLNSSHEKGDLNVKRKEEG